MELNNEFFVTLGITVLNIVVLFVVLRLLLFKPVTKHIDNRNKKIEDALKAAEESQKMVRQMKVEYDEKIKEAKEEGQKVIEMYRGMAEKEYNGIIDSAKAEADQIIENAKTELKVEKEQLITSMKEELAELVFAASEKVLKKNIDDDTNRKLISEFINEKSVS
ncbi:MAG: F0F1 ATP synthase subunit B [Clostridia bacterium]|nr:F0F1 ATP synthase subunit B [Clostridia bacterium]